MGVWTGTPTALLDRLHPETGELLDDLPVDLAVAAARRPDAGAALYTVGLSARRMDVPAAERAVQHARVEMLMLLPEGAWAPPFDVADIEGPREWPLHLLADLAHYALTTSSFVGCGHLLLMQERGPDGRARAAAHPWAQPYPGVVFVPPELFGQPMPPLVRADGERVQFLVVVPLHEDEVRLGLDQGAHTLLSRLAAAGLGDVVRWDRPSVA